MIIRGAGHCVKWLNAFPPKGGVSDQYAPRILAMKRPLDYIKDCSIGWGRHVQASNQNNPTNTNLERTVTGIVIKHLENIQGGYELMDLQTGNAITRHYAKELPITPEVIKRVEELAKRDGFRPHAEPIIRTYALLAGVDNQNDNTKEDNTEQEEDNIEQEEQSVSDNDESVSDDDDDDSMPELVEMGDAGGLEDSDEEDSEKEEPFIPGVADNQSTFSEDPIPDGDPIPELLRRSDRVPVQRTMLSPTFQGKTYDVNHLVAQVKPTSTLEYTTEEAPVLIKAFGKIFAQTYSLKQGMKKWGKEATKAAETEMRQLHDRFCWRPLHVKDLTSKQRRLAMNSLFFLTEKRDGRIKGRTVADGSKQRLWINKDEVSSPTVATESIILSAIIDAKEGREVAILDIPNAFIQTENEKLKPHHERDVIKIKGVLADMLVAIDPEMHGPYLTKENGVSVLYLELR